MSIHPTLRYDDASAASEFLTGTLGFVEQSMIGARTDPPSPFDTGRAVIYLALDGAGNVDAHHDRAVAAGATVVQELVDQPYGSREYAVADPEGNVWSVGSYRPERKPATEAGS